MEDYVDILDQDGNPLNRWVLKSEAHQKGYYHNTAHVWIYTSQGEILLAQRAASKAICPLLWDVSAAGHVDAGETIESAAIREVQEELGVGLSKDSLQMIGVFESFRDYDNGMKDYEFHNTFIAKVQKEAQKFHINQEEVNAIKWVSANQFQELLDSSATNSHFVTFNTPYYKYVLAHIEEAIKNP